MASHSFILQAVTIRTPANAERGMRLITGPRKNMEHNSTTAWNTLVRRVAPPLLIATEVRAMAAVAGTPPKNGITMFPKPWARSSC